MNKEIAKFRQQKLNIINNIKSFVPQIIHPGLKEDTEWLVNLIFQDKFQSKIEKDLFCLLTGFCFPSLMTNRIISYQPCDESPIFVGHRNNNYEISNIKSQGPRFIKLGEGYSVNELSETDITDLVIRLSIKIISGWDQFAIYHLDQLSKITLNSWVEWGPNAIARLMYLKEQIESENNLPVTWILLNKKMFLSIQDDPWFFSCEETKFVSGSLVGKWKEAEVYCTNLLSNNTSALLGYKGNTTYDSPLIIAISRVAIPSPIPSWTTTSLYGYGELLLGWENCGNYIGKLSLSI